jgi:hypothetical protein
MKSNWRFRKACILTFEMSTNPLTHFGIMWRWKLLVKTLRVSAGEERSGWNANGQGLAVCWFFKRERHTYLGTCTQFLLIFEPALFGSLCNFLLTFSAFAFPNVLLVKCHWAVTPLLLPGFCWVRFKRLWIAPRFQCSTSTASRDPVFSSSQSLRPSPPGAWRTRWH